MAEAGSGAEQTMALSPRFERERRTMEAMIAIYCRDRHGFRQSLCDRCTALLDYAEQRLDRCVFPDNKPTCADCPVHCYRPDIRAAVKEIMRYAGPHMIYQHPYLAIRHILDGRNKGPFTRRKPDGSGAGSTSPGAADASRDGAGEGTGSAPG